MLKVLLTIFIYLNINLLALENTDNILELTKQEKNYLQHKKIINICLDPNWMPFEKFNESGQHIGISSDYFNIFKQKIGIPIVPIVTTSWSQTLEFSENRNCDILTLGNETPERKKYMDFTKPYLKIPFVIATKNHVPFFNSVSILKDEKIGVVKNSSLEELLKIKYPNLNLVKIKSDSDGIAKVQNNELFGIAGNMLSIGYILKKNFIVDIKIMNKLDSGTSNLAIGIRNDDKTLFNIFEKLINSINPDVKNEILHKYINIKYEKNIDYKYLKEILIIAFIIVIAFIDRQLILKSLNKKLEKKVVKKTKELQSLNNTLELRVAEKIKESKRKDEILFEQSKLASMGEMMENIAHQWRQPLNNINLLNHYLRDNYKNMQDTEIASTIAESTTQIQFMSNTIDDFRNFAKGESIKKLFNLSVEIDSFLELVNGVIKNNDIKIILDLDNTIEVNGYIHELRQCLINIFNNSKDAPISCLGEKKLIFIKTYSDGNHVNIHLKDNGGGISQDILTKIFDPYFTTKHQSQGTGLGLNITYKLIVDCMKGLIEASNVNYKYNGIDYMGAEFRITIPKN